MVSGKPPVPPNGFKAPLKFHTFCNFIRKCFYMRLPCMNSMQIEFVQRLINIIVEQGEINMDALMKGRAPFDCPKFFTLFGKEAQNRIFDVVRNINMNARDVA